MMIGRCSLLFLSAALGTGSAVAAQPASVATGCDNAQQRAFDYFVGDWRLVHTATGRDFAQNRVERVHDGCAIRENLRLLNGAVGSNLNFYSAVDGLWHAFYHDSSGLYGHLTGLMDAQGRQELSGDGRFIGDSGRVRKFRQITSRDEAGRPRQVGFLLDESDLSWRQIYDITFCANGQERSERRPPC